MRVYDIFAEAAEYLATNDQTHVFRACTRASEYLAAKGDWDILKGYVDLPVQNHNIVVLPWQVETPLKFTINNVPAFSRDRLYEFTLNGFGSAPGSDRTDYSWEDRGFVPTNVIPPTPFRLAIKPSAVNAGKKVIVQGMTPNNVEVKETLTINAEDTVLSTYAYGKLTEVNKDITQDAVSLYGFTPNPVGGGSNYILGPDWTGGTTYQHLFTPIGLYDEARPSDDQPYAGIIAEQLQDMFNRGQKHIVLMLVHNTSIAPPDTPVPSNYVRSFSCYTYPEFTPTHPPDGSGDLFPQHKQNLISLLTLFNQIGFTKFVLRFNRSTGRSDPHYWTEWNELQFQTAKNYILNTIALIEAHKGNLQTVYDLQAEGASLAIDKTSSYFHQPSYDWFWKMWQAVTQRFGTSISAGYSLVNAATTSFPAPPLLQNEGSLDAMIKAFNDNDLPLPSYYGADLYQRTLLPTPPENGDTLVHYVLKFIFNYLAEYDRDALTREHLKPIYVIESYYNDASTGADIRRAVSDTGMNFAGVYQWPLLAGTSAQDRYFPDGYPKAFSNYVEVAAPLDPSPPVEVPPPLFLIAVYLPFETNPRYRMLRLSQTGYTAHFLFRRKVFKIYSMDDFIPIQSELGFLTMVQAIQALRRKDLETAKALADAAVEITTDAQRATTGFIELANNTEIQEARNYNIYNRDSVIMLDIFDDVAKILGNVGENVIFDTTTTGLELLCNKGHYDGLTGYVDIQTDGWRYATLPRFVDQPVAISINGRPAYMRNKWSEFHLNGPGSDEYGGQHMGGMQFGSWYGFGGSGRWGQVHAWDSVGEVVTIKPLSAVSQLVAVPDNPADDGKTYRIFGYDEAGKRIYGADGQDGFVLTVDHNKLVPNRNTDQRVAQIDRIKRDATRGFVRLYAFDQAQQVTSVLLGYHYPDETEPQYFRIKLPLDAKWIRLRYRKRTYKVTSVWQPLHLFSRTAIITMVRALKLLESDAAAAEQMEQKAVKYLDDDQKARNPGETFQLQFDEGTGWGSNFIVS